MRPLPGAIRPDPALPPLSRRGWHPHTFFYVIISRPLRLLVRFCYRVRVRKHPGFHPDLICVLAANHRSFADPPLVSMFNRHPTAFFARASLWKLPPVRMILQLVGGVPVDRARPSPRSMQAVVQQIREGRSLVVFPEGTRTRDGRLGRLLEGPALFARRAGVPVVPVYVHASERIWPRDAALPRLGGGVEVRYGRPMRAPEQLSGREQDRWLTRYLERWMRAQERSLQGGHD